MDRFDRDDDALESKEGFRRAFPRRGGVDEMPLLPSFMMCVMVFYWGRCILKIATWPRGVLFNSGAPPFFILPL